MDQGFNLEAKWLNDTQDTVRFGYTTKDEMFIAYMHYTTKLPTGIEEADHTIPGLSLYPNPFDNTLVLDYDQADENLTVEVYDMSGKQIAAAECAANDGYPGLGQGHVLCTPGK